MQFSQAILLVFSPKTYTTKSNFGTFSNSFERTILTRLKPTGVAVRPSPYPVLHLILRSHHKSSAFHHITQQYVRTTRSCAIGSVQGQVEEEEGTGRLTVRWCQEAKGQQI